MNRIWVFIAGFLLRYLMKSPEEKKEALENVKTGIDNVVDSFTVPNWVSNKDVAKQFLKQISDTEKYYKIPNNLLLRLIQQESHFRPDIIEGRTVSGAGAVGIAQIVPKWHPKVDPLDPVASIKYAGMYLKSLYNMFGKWDLALRGYNWGPGNVSEWLKGNKTEPTETRNYVADISRDVPGVIG